MVTLASIESKGYSPPGFANRSRAVCGGRLRRKEAGHHNNPDPDPGYAEGTKYAV